MYVGCPHQVILREDKRVALLLAIDLEPVVVNLITRWTWKLWNLKLEVPAVVMFNDCLVILSKADLQAFKYGACHFVFASPITLWRQFFENVNDYIWMKYFKNPFVPIVITQIWFRMSKLKWKSPPNCKRALELDLGLRSRRLHVLFPCKLGQQRRDVRSSLRPRAYEKPRCLVARYILLAISFGRFGRRSNLDILVASMPAVLLQLNWNSQFQRQFFSRFLQQPANHI